MELKHLKSVPAFMFSHRFPVPGYACHEKNHAFRMINSRERYLRQKERRHPRLPSALAGWCNTRVFLPLVPQLPFPRPLL